MRLIDADDALRKIDICGTNRFGMLDEDIREFVKRMPTIDAEPIRHGEWVMDDRRPDTLICTLCNEAFDVWKHDKQRMKYCPNCGAKMDKGET